MKTLAMCIRCKDDPDCLKENIEYHTLIGVEHFFIYDHMSELPLKDVLSGYEIWWKNFGTSGYQRVQKSVIHSYTKVVSEKSVPCYKTILNTKFGTPFIKNPHWCTYSKGKYGVDEDFNKLKVPPELNKMSEIKRNKIQLNHYIVRSEEDFKKKIKRFHEGGNPKQAKKMETFALNSGSTTDTSIIDFLTELKGKN